MKLFLKIFLWFLAAIALMIGVMIFVTRTFQTEPQFTRWQKSARNQLVFYSLTAEQVRAAGGDPGLHTYLSRLTENGTISDVSLIAENGTVIFGEPKVGSDILSAIDRCRQTGLLEIDVNGTDPAVGAVPVSFGDGRNAFLAIRWEPPRAPSLFFDSWLGYARLAGVLLTAILLCYVLALYLTSPIRKLRQAAQRLAEGDLSTRVTPLMSRRRDELADLARDFDEMATRIESLITSQQRLTRDISHELRSPLARLNVALEIAKQRSSEESRPVLDRIESESHRLNEMIGRLLTLARLESGTEAIDLKIVDLTELVNDVVSDADFEAKAKGKSVSIKQMSTCSVMGSEDLLRSAIENVLRNAVRYTPVGTSVDVSLLAKNGSVRVSVCDHGGGVPADELDNLFKPFYRVGEARERTTGGIGLGLAIAERAVSAHKGKIFAQNRNGGLEIEIELAAASQAEA